MPSTNDEKSAVMEQLRVDLGGRSYDILIGRGLRDQLAADLAARGEGSVCAVVADKNTAPLFGEPLVEELRRFGVRAGMYVIEPGEESKCLATFEWLLHEFKALGLKRHDLVVSVGGGVVGDVSGFAAGCYMRGVDYIQFPTTLLSQVDSSVGGKVAVNLGSTKNYCGLFNQPRQVYLDVSVLKSLPEREVKSGLGEVCKYALMADAELYGFLMENADAILALDDEIMPKVIAWCCHIKSEVVAEDERETTGIRALLNYGHTFGHALEEITDFALSHGEAVAYGMKAAGLLSNKMGILSDEEYEMHHALLSRFGLADKRLHLDVDRFMEAMNADKKAGTDTLRYILASHIGVVEVREDVPLELVQEVVEWLVG
ncbi:3-dehydroquinate synthase [Desulfovibrio inopinatus]|uniref:3-dehydroquinate synthase n=1 Tax=Desulfovibrio inopinatus TaxID=102109 RepID=UPI0003F81F69|nr:3-dehydroquinate synthase [Desulfovibrio inopinatus]